MQVQEPGSQSSSKVSPADLLAEIDDKDITLEKAVELFETVHMASRNLTDETRRGYQIDIGQLTDFLGKVGISKPPEVSRKHLEGFLAELDRKGVAGVTRRRKTSVIKSFFSFLATYELITTNPAQRLIPPKQQHKERRGLSRDQCRQLLRVCSHNTRDAAIMEIFLQTGIRLTEMTRLTMDDIELPDRIKKDGPPGSILVRGKGRRQRVLPLNYKACRAIKAWLTVRPDNDSPFLFITMFGQPLGKRSIQKAMKKYMAEAGIKNASVHTLRHTVASHLLDKGMPLSNVQKILGHANIKTTSIYLHANDRITARFLQEHAL